MKFRPTYAFAALVVTLLAAAPAGAQTVETFDALYKEWMAKHKVELGVLAVSRQGKLVFNRGYGGRDANRAVPLASLSKAITGVCTASLIDAGKFSFESRVGDVLPGYFKKFGEPFDPRIKNATVGQLLSHRTGFDRTAVDSSGKKITGPYMFEHLKVEHVGKTAIPQLLSRALIYRLPHDPGATYSYTNEAFFMLGAIIEESTGRQYGDYCEETVLRPLGIRGAKIDTLWSVWSSAGGWNLSGPQYLRFLQFYDTDSKVLGPLGRKFLTDGEGKWQSDKQEIFYALGIHVRPLKDGRFNLYHGGDFRSTIVTTLNGHLSHNTGTYFVRFASGTAWFAQFEPNPPGSADVELDRAMSKAIGSIKQWPAADLFAEIDKK